MMGCHFAGLLAVVVCVVLIVTTTDADASLQCAQSWYETTPHGSIFRNVKHFGAIGDGQTDDTRAIQAAIDQDRGNFGASTPAIVYLPPGHYIVSDTLVAWFYTNIVGSSSMDPNCATIIELASGSNGYAQNSSAAPYGYLVKPVVVFSSGFNTKRSVHAWWAGAKWNSSWCLNNSLTRCGDGFNMNFYAHIRFVTIRIGSNNPGASGLMWNVAQQTSIRNVSIDMSQSGCIGLDVSGDTDVASYNEFGGGGDQGGGGTIEDVQISGGIVGMRASGSQWTFRSISIRNSKQVALVLRHTGTWSFTILDLHVDNAPIGLEMNRNQATLLLDCTFNNIHGRAAIVLDDPSQILLEGVAHTGTELLLTSGDVNLTSVPEGQMFYIGRGFVNSKSQPIFGTMPVPAWRWRPKLRPRPTFDDVATDAVFNVREHGCAGDWNTDDTECLQTVINLAAKVPNSIVFLPFGFYRVTDTIMLSESSTLVGEGLSRIVLGDNATGYGSISSPKPMLATPNAANGCVQLVDVRLTSGAGNVGAILLSWGTGLASSLWDVHITVGSAPEGAGGLGIQDAGEVHTLMHIWGSGGGIFSNVHGWGADHNVSDDQSLPDGHALHGVRGDSQGPAVFVGCAFEHHTLGAFNLTGASNYTFYALQTEQTARAVELHGSDAIAIFGTVITWSGENQPSLVYTDSTAQRTEIYGLNTLMKRQALQEPMWVMVSYEDDATKDVPALNRTLSGSGNWNGRCHSGDCAMMIRYN